MYGPFGIHLNVQTLLEFPSGAVSNSNFRIGALPLVTPRSIVGTLVRKTQELAGEWYYPTKRDSKKIKLLITVMVFPVARRDRVDSSQPPNPAPSPRLLTVSSRAEDFPGGAWRSG